MAEHTHGPWLASARASSVVGWPIVQPGTGRLICNINYVQRTNIDPSVPGDQAFNAESKANARLIAAAPELLDALKAARAILNPEISPNACAMADFAIAKAKGE